MHFGIILESFWTYCCFYFAIKISIKNALQISSNFRSILGCILVPLASHLAPKIGPKIEGRGPLGVQHGPRIEAQRPQEAPRTPLEEAWQRRLFPDPFCGSF